MLETSRLLLILPAIALSSAACQQLLSIEDVKVADGDGGNPNNSDASPGSADASPGSADAGAVPDAALGSVGVNLLGTPALVTNANEAVFVFVGNSDALSFACGVDGMPPVDCDSPFRVADLSSSQPTLHTFEVSAVDSDGVRGPPTVYEWTVDQELPETTFDSSPNISGTTGIFEFSSSEPVNSQFRCSLNGGPSFNCQSPHTLAQLGRGVEQTFEVQAVDLAGNMDSSPAITMFDVAADTMAVPADTTLTGYPALISNVLTGSFAFTTSYGPYDSFICKLNSDSAAACDSPFSFAPGEGQHQFEVYVRRPTTSQSDESPAIYTFTIDTTAPTSQIGSSPTAVSISNQAIFNFSSNEPGATFECSFDGGAFSPCASPHAYTGISLGEHEFEVRPTDAAGNLGTSSTWAWTYELP